MRPCLTILAALLSVAAVAGCRLEERPIAINTPEDALRGFYAAVVRDRDFQGACRYTAPDFHLRPSNVVGVNISANDANELPTVPEPGTERRRGPCSMLVQRVHEKRGDHWPWSAWIVESVTVAKDGDTAEAVTMDGSAGLQVVDDEWRVLWVFDSL